MKDKLKELAERWAAEPNKEDHQRATRHCGEQLLAILLSERQAAMQGQGGETHETDAQRAEDYAQYVGYAFLRLIEVARKVPGYEGDGEFNEAIRMVDHYVGKATLRYRDEQEKGDGNE